MRVGLDIGSTTIKAIVADMDGGILFSKYERHQSHIIEKSIELLEEIGAAFPQSDCVRAAISGSAGMGLAKSANVPFVQEVHATSICARGMGLDADVIIELGGEDAKILFLKGAPEARMNGSCAGGTGAFIDQMATLLKLTPATLNERAKENACIYNIASRCGVFAKSDIQPLLNQGARVEDVAASILYAVANQTVAGLAQGRKIAGNVVYLGGPLTFMSELRRAFDDTLRVQGVLPENSLYFVSIGAALSAEQGVSLSELVKRLKEHAPRAGFDSATPLFSSEAEYAAFLERHSRAHVDARNLSGYKDRAHIGIDAGSTTVKLALLDDAGALLYSAYLQNSGNPVPLVKQCLEEIYAQAPNIHIVSATATGYGEQLIKTAFQLDYGIVETVAHFTAAKFFEPEVDFIIDIGGQDMKCFKIEKGAISDIFLNEACSSGCGSFLQTFAHARGDDIETFARRALFGDAPVELGSRCTVFMNSSVKQAQKDGASVENISAGLAISVVKNAIYKVIRPASPEELGKHIVVQGGTFLNDAVLRAFERELSLHVVRPSIAGLMGAFGAALYGKEHAHYSEKSTLLQASELFALSHDVRATRCNACTNHCPLTVNTFSNGRKFISGNRCERPVKNTPPRDDLNLYEYKRQLLSQFSPVPGKRGKIGIPFGLNIYELLPFFHTLFTKLGFEVITSPPSTRELYFSGQHTIPSDTVCYPAKLMHGHIHALCAREDIQYIFYPCMSYHFDEGNGSNHFNCPVVAYYPEVIAANSSELDQKTFIYDYIGIDRPSDFVYKFHGICKKYFGAIPLREVRAAVEAGYSKYFSHMHAIRKRAQEIIVAARAEKKPIIVLSGRPYHVDAGVNHGIDKLIVSHGAAVISEDSISHLPYRVKLRILNQWTYHARLYAAAQYVAEEADMELVQLVSFGCGLDAVTSDEVRDILHRYNKLYTQIKIDEITNLGAVNIRLRSMMAALEGKHAGKAEENISYAGRKNDETA